MTLREQVRDLSLRVVALEAEIAEAKRALAEYDKIRIAREEYIISLIPQERP